MSQPTETPAVTAAPANGDFYDAARPKMKKEVLDVAYGDANAATKAANASALTSTAKMFDINSLYIAPGFNARIADAPSFTRGLSALADSMMENGFLNSKPLTGFPISIDGKDVVQITDGHRRLAAAKEARARGMELSKLPVILVPKGTSASDLQLRLITENSGAPLTMFETGVVVKRLRTLGMGEADIARKLGFSSTHISNLLSLVGAPSEVREAVVNEMLSATDAITLIRDAKGDKNALKKAVEDKVKARQAKLVTREAKARGEKAPPSEGPKMLKSRFEVNLQAGAEVGEDDLLTKVGVDRIQAIDAMLGGDDGWRSVGSIEGSIRLASDLKIVTTVERPETAEQMATRVAAELAERKRKDDERAATKAAADRVREEKKAKALAEKNSKAASANAAKDAAEAAAEADDI